MNLFVICLILPFFARGYNVDLFEDAFFKGRKHHILSSECENIPKSLAGKISSLDTHGTCVFVYQKQGCTGNLAMIAPGTWGHSNLNDIMFDNTVMSIGPCWTSQLQ